MRITLPVTNLTEWLSFGPGTIEKVWGSNPQPADLWLQFFENPIVTAGDVPAVRPFWFPALVDTYYLDTPPLFLDEMFAAVSTTQDVYTAPGAGLGLDVTIEYVTNYPVKPTTTIVGDLTTDIDYLQVWAESAGPKKLRRLDLLADIGGTFYFWIVARDSPGATILSNAVGPFKVLETGSRTVLFGDGLSPFEQTFSGGVRTTRQGCTVLVTQFPEIGTDVNTDPDFNIRAIYE